MLIRQFSFFFFSKHYKCSINFSHSKIRNMKSKKIKHPNTCPSTHTYSMYIHMSIMMFFSAQSSSLKNMCKCLNFSFKKLKEWKTHKHFEIYNKSSSSQGVLIMPRLLPQLLCFVLLIFSCLRTSHSFNKGSLICLFLFWRRGNFSKITLRFQCFLFLVGKFI